ncbi:hypothetical protein, partial [Sinomonas sp.]|uniref:hypothetical protein n=1 Tax=Sinomonas sp. TaxID=1914986 RepID=UPI002FDFFEFE
MPEGASSEITAPTPPQQTDCGSPSAPRADDDRARGAPASSYDDGRPFPGRLAGVDPTQIWSTN